MQTCNNKWLTYSGSMGQKSVRNNVLNVWRRKLKRERERAGETQSKKSFRLETWKNYGLRRKWVKSNRKLNEIVSRALKSLKWNRNKSKLCSVCGFVLFAFFFHLSSITVHFYQLQHTFNIISYYYQLGASRNQTLMHNRMISPFLCVIFNICDQMQNNLTNTFHDHINWLKNHFQST